MNQMQPLRINKRKFEIFLEVAAMLKGRFSVTPILFGSLGLYTVIGEKATAHDIDILVPEFVLNKRWDNLMAMMGEMNFALHDPKEHEFMKADEYVAFGREEDLQNVFDLPLDRIEISERARVQFKMLTPEQYLVIYTKTARDTYRREKLHRDDRQKAQWIKHYLKSK